MEKAYRYSCRERIALLHGFVQNTPETTGMCFFIAGLSHGQATYPVKNSVTLKERRIVFFNFETKLGSMLGPGSRQTADNTTEESCECGDGRDLFTNGMPVGKAVPQIGESGPGECMRWQCGELNIDRYIV